MVRYCLENNSEHCYHWHIRDEEEIAFIAAVRTTIAAVFVLEWKHNADLKSSSILMMSLGLTIDKILNLYHEVQVFFSFLLLKEFTNSQASVILN